MMIVHDLMERPTLDLLDTLGDLHRTCGEFLLANAETAHKLLDTAAAASEAGMARRKIRTARGSLEMTNRFLAKLRLHPALRAAVERARDELGRRIEAVERGKRNSPAPRP